MNYEIFGFQPQNNTPTDEVLRSLREDAALLEQSVFEPSRLLALYSHLGKLLQQEDSKSYAALAAIGLTEFLLSRNIGFKEIMSKVFFEALELDPLSKYEERVVLTGGLKAQLLAYIDDPWGNSNALSD